MSIEAKGNKLLRQNELKDSIRKDIETASVRNAAPDLLEACKAFVAYDDSEKESDFITMMFAYSDAVAKARAAIEKAEGKA